VTVAAYGEAAAPGRVVSVPLSHLSMELGHFYVEDFEAGVDHITGMLRPVAPWARIAEQGLGPAIAPARPRVSTCFLVDDYFSELPPPGDLLPMLLDAAAQAGLTLDYVARESACARNGDVPVADLLVSRIVDDPSRGANGSRPPTRQTGWLCNGARSPQKPLDEAMRPEADWRAPQENRAVRHSIFVDVELWSDGDGGRLWSCALLAAAWQLVRLGAIRSHGEPVMTPQPWPDPYPDTWAELPAVMQRNPRAAPFTAHRTFSVLAGRYLPIEHAVRTILNQVAVEPAVAEDLARRAQGEKLALPHQVIDRIEYAFAGEPWKLL